MAGISFSLSNNNVLNLSEQRQERIKHLTLAGLNNPEALRFAHHAITHMGLWDRLCDFIFHGGTKHAALENLATVFLYSAALSQGGGTDWLPEGMTHHSYIKASLELIEQFTPDGLNKLIANNNLPIEADLYGGVVTTKPDMGSDEVNKLFTFQLPKMAVVLLLEKLGYVEYASKVSPVDTINYIASELSPPAREYFSCLLEIKEVSSPSLSSPIVSGDTDGSTARSVLLGIQAGIINISNKGIKCLLPLLEAEAAIANNLQSGSFVGFQKNTLLQNKLSELADNLTYSQGSRSLIFIGDVAHDRFSLNKDADFIIRENIHNNGGIFVLGNHDYIESCSCLKSAQTGKAARNTISEDVWKSHEKMFLLIAIMMKKTGRCTYIMA